MGSGGKLSANDRMLLGTKMSPGSLAMIMGRSAAWVERQRAALRLEAGRDIAQDAAVWNGLGAPDVAPPEPEPVQTNSVKPARAPGRVSPAVVRWARQFRSAGWKLSEVAHLFDLDVRDLAEVLRS